MINERELDVFGKCFILHIMHHITFWYDIQIGSLFNKYYHPSDILIQHQISILSNYFYM